MFHAEKRLFVLMLLFTPIVAADEFTWTGGGANTAWSNPENWSNDSGGAATFPTAADNVTFPTDAVTTNGSALGLTNSAVLQAGLGTISLAGGPVTNTGLITFEGHGSTGNEVYSLSADTTFSGTGTLRLKELNDSFIVGAGTLTNGVGHTLRGTGRVEVPVVNQGQLVAEGGVLHLSGGVLENSAGAITLAADGVLSVASTLIEGGALHGEVGGSLGGGGTLRGVTTTGQIAQQAGVTFLDGVIANSGRLTYQAGGSTADEVYQLVGAVTLAGVGELVLQEATDSFLTGDGPLTQDGGHVLRGSGQLLVDVINHNGSVMVDPDARLFVTDRTISGGAVAFDATGRLQGTPTLKNLTLSGTAVRSPGVTQLEGTLTNLGEITYEASGSTADEVYRLAADATLAGAGVLRLREANDSFITGAVGTEVLTNGPNHTLRGAGQINTAIINQNLIIAEQGVLTLAGGAVDNTQGSIGVAADGTLTATGTTISGGSIAFAPGSTLGDGGTLDSLATTGVVRQWFGATSLMGTITNNGELTYIESGSTANAAYQLATDVTLNGAGTLRLIELNDHFVIGALGDEVLTNGPNHTVRGAGDIGVSIVNQGALVAERGTLRVTGSTVDNADGVIVVGADGLLSAASVIHDGVLQAELGALIGDGATLRDLQLVGQLTQSFGVTKIDGTITNHGLLTYINDISTANAVIRVDGAATLTGSGTLRLTELNDAFLDGAGTLTNTGGHTIRGTGEINLNILNTGGVIRVDPAAQLRVSGKTITGGVLNSAESGRLIGTPTLRDLTLTGTQVRTFGVTSLGGTLQNNGLMTYERSASTANAVYELVDDVTLSGGGELQLREAQDHYVTGLTGEELLTNGPGHTLSGSGQVQVEVLNEGTVRPGAAMSLTQGYTQGATAELLANNVDLVDWSELMVAGAAMLDGGLVIDYVGLIPVGVHTFDLLKADSISGDFTGLTIVDALPWVGTASYEILPDEIGVTDVLRVTVENAASGLPGDYNNDGFVDAADYTTWRDLSGRNYPMPNDVTPGVVEAADYAVWRANYGAVVAGPAAAAAPEPATLLLLVVAGLTRRVRR